MTTDRLAERILQIVNARDYSPSKASELAQVLGIADGEMGNFHDACKALMRSGRVVLGTRDALVLPSLPGHMTGRLRTNPRGFGFVVPDAPSAHGDLYVAPGGMGDAITGDHVLVEVRKRGKREGRMLYEGRVVRVLRRGLNRFVGELLQQGKRWMIVPEGNVLHVPILVGDPGAKGAKPGDQVVVELTQYPRTGVDARGVVVKILGPNGDPGVDTQSIIEQYGLPAEFPAACVDEARRMVSEYNEAAALAGRDDLTKLMTVTIDPVDARDFDDAISLVPQTDGLLELGVHIADVAYFVRDGGALDAEAKDRANSIYLPRMVLPMLPEVLSNGLCSLQEGEIRLTRSAFITYDADGEVVRARFSNSYIRSAKRLTYEEASAILEGKGRRRSAKLVALLKEMEQLARTIRTRRLREGMLVLDVPDAELVFDSAGRVKDVVPADTSFSHTIIEMFMVEANEAVSRALTEAGTAHLRRTHAPPEDLGSGVLQQFLRALGHKLKDDADRRDVQRLLDEVRDRPESFAVHLAVLRSMEQAEYSPRPIGHYALASSHYCHFTSPIRRYPDLTIHRLLEAYIRGELSAQMRRGATPSTDDLEKLGEHCSGNERRAESAERELRLVLTLRFLEQHLGEEVDGTVTGIANVGVYVQLDRYLVDGLIRFEGLLDDWWDVDPGRGSVVGERTGVRIRVGDRLRVGIAKISIVTRQLDLELVSLPVGLEPAADEKGKRPARRSAGGSERGGRKKASRPRTRRPGTGRGRGSRKR